MEMENHLESFVVFVENFQGKIDKIPTWRKSENLVRLQFSWKINSFRRILDLNLYQIAQWKIVESTVEIELRISW
jgi:hypothetical protein